MTERLAEVSARISGIQQLSAVVNAMRGIAAARAGQARTQLGAVDRYAAMLATAIARALSLIPLSQSAFQHPSRIALVLFCAEQGFAGAFSERVLNAAGADLATCDLFLVGTRGRAAMAERGITAGWSCQFPAHSPGIPKLAETIVTALYRVIATNAIDRLDVLYCKWQPGHGPHFQRKTLFPFDTTAFPPPSDANAPLLNLLPRSLLQNLTADYMHAQLCEAALHSFAAENEARMEAMAAAHNQIERQLAALQATQRLVRQEEITAEIIELASGEAASRGRAGLTVHSERNEHARNGFAQHRRRPGMGRAAGSPPRPR